jgi:small nuclear ribonucleoprotein B and B'
MTQKSKFLQWIDFRVRITIQDGRMMVGTFMAYDKHMNVVLADTDEYRITKSKKTGVQKQIKRTLGLVIIRGENIVSLTAEAPPSQHKKIENEATGVGKAQAINRAGTMPTQPGTAKSSIQMPSIPPLQTPLVPPMGPLPTNLQAPNVSVQLPKPPTLPPK